MIASELGNQRELHRSNARHRHQAPAHFVVPDNRQHLTVQDGDLIAQHPADNKQRFDQSTAAFASRMDSSNLLTMVSKSGTERILAFRGPGAIVGELAIIDKLPRAMSAVALRDAVLSFLSRTAFEKVLQKNIPNSANRC